MQRQVLGKMLEVQLMAQAHDLATLLRQIKPHFHQAVLLVMIAVSQTYI